jgi:hypothetical protein
VIITSNAHGIYGVTVKAGLGVAVRAVILQEPTVCVLGTFSWLVELLKPTLMVTGEAEQLLRILKFTPDTVPVNASGPPLATFNVHGRFNNWGTPHSALEPLTVAPVIEALEPSAATEPVKAMLQVTGRFNDAGEVTVIEPDVENAVPAGAIVAALAIDTAPRLRANEVAQTRVFKLFIILPHI